jgi:tRNA(adenine34) deaminase
MTDLSTADAKFLRRAIALAEAAVESGNRPFGALVVDGGGQVIAEGYSTQQGDRDWTAHAEMNVLRTASRILAWDELGKATLYASGDPCPMCSGAMYWSNVRRLVFGLDEAAMRPLRSGNPQGRGLAMSCREVLSTSSHPIEVIGPALQEEAGVAHMRFWKAAESREGWA